MKSRESDVLAEGKVVKSVGLLAAPVAVVKSEKVAVELEALVVSSSTLDTVPPSVVRPNSSVEVDGAPVVEAVTSVVKPVQSFLS